MFFCVTELSGLGICNDFTIQYKYHKNKYCDILPYWLFSRAVSNQQQRWIFKHLKWNVWVVVHWLLWLTKNSTNIIFCRCIYSISCVPQPTRTHQSHAFFQFCLMSLVCRAYPGFKLQPALSRWITPHLHTLLAVTHTHSHTPLLLPMAGEHYISHLGKGHAGDQPLSSALGSVRTAGSCWLTNLVIKSGWPNTT